MNRSKVVDYLKENTGLAVSIARDFNLYDGSFPEFEYYYLEDLIDGAKSDLRSCRDFIDDLYSAIRLGEFSTYESDDLIRYNSNGGLEVCTDSELEEEVLDCIDEIADKLEDAYQYIYIDDELFISMLKEDDDSTSYKASLAKHSIEDI